MALGPTCASKGFGRLSPRISEDNRLISPNSYQSASGMGEGPILGTRGIVVMIICVCSVVHETYHGMIGCL